MKNKFSLIILVSLLVSIAAAHAYEHNYVYENCIGELERTGEKFAYFDFRFLDGNNTPVDFVMYKHGRAMMTRNAFYEMWEADFNRNQSISLHDYGVICFYRYVGEQIKFTKGVDY